MRTLGLGLFFVILIFNPFAFPGLYIDSTASFGFIAMPKIFLLIVLNSVLLVIWTIKIYKTRELKILSSPIYFPIFLWIASLLISSLSGPNPIVSFYGMNNTLENSFIEGIMILLLFLITINNLKLREDLEEVTRFVVLGFSVSFLYTIIRYLSSWKLDNEFFGYYFNNNTFTLIGHYGSLPIVSLIAIILSTGLVISDIIYERTKKALIFDLIVLFISSSTYAITLNMGGYRPEYIYLIAGLILLSIIGYMVFSHIKLQITLIPVFGVIAIGLIAGFALHFGITKNVGQPINYPSLSIDATWNIVLDSIKGSLQAGLFGRGPGGFGYYFDVFKNESVALPINNIQGQPLLTNFTINAQSPSVEEIRVYQPGSLVLGILHAQGLFGILALILIVSVTISIAIKKGLENIGILGVIAFMSFIALIIISIFARYDFILMLIIWLTLAIFTISASTDEPNKNVSIMVTGRTYDFGHNLNYLVPLLMLIGTLFAIANTYRIFIGDFYAYQAKLGQIANNIERYQLNANLAFASYPESDIFVRESVYASAITLSNQIDELQKEITKNPEKANSEEITRKINDIIERQKVLINDLQIAKNFKPMEYKNYYLEGLMLSRLSEILELRLDSQAAQAFEEAKLRNSYHPDSYYQTAKLTLRNAKRETDYIAAANAISVAIRYRPVNFLYQSTYADVLKALGNYEGALQIYEALKQLKENNLNNEMIKRLYENENIEQKIEDTKKRKEEIVPSPTPTPSRTPTSTKR